MNIIKTFEGFTSRQVNQDLYEKLMFYTLLKCMGRTRTHESGDIHIDAYEGTMITALDLDGDFIIRSKNGGSYKLTCIEIDFNYTRLPETSLLVDLDSEEYPADEYDSNGEIPIEDVANLEELVEYMES